MKIPRNMESDMKVTENVAQVFCGSYDHKHINNTAPNKEIPQQIIDRLNYMGMTIESIDALIDKGYPVYKYMTQITVHGICNEIKSNKVGQYVALVINQNKSLGIRWLAVDHGKKAKIANALNHEGWSCFHDSRGWMFSMYEKDNEESYLKLKAIKERIDPTKFFGGVDICRAKTIVGRYLFLRLTIHGIYQENVEPLIEQATDRKYSEIKAEIEEEKEKERREYEAWKRKSEEAAKKRAEEMQTIREEYLKENPMPSHIKGMVQSGDMFIKLYEGYGIVEWHYYTVYKAGGRLCAARCTKEGKKIYKGHEVEQREDYNIINRSNMVASIVPTNIRVVDYTERSIAIVGDTKPIKDVLKKLGCRFNKFLRIEGTTMAGWIASIEKREKIINTLNIK